MLQGLKIYEKVPEDIQKYITNFYSSIENRIVQRNLIRYKIPTEICYLILTFLNTDYTFDEDSVFISFHPLVFMVDNVLQVSLYSWYGTKEPDNYSPGAMLHTEFDRPYSIRLERKFGNIAKNIYDGIKHLNFREDIIEKEFSFIGTYGPIKQGLLNNNGVYYSKLNNSNWHFSTRDLLNYFKEMRVINNNVENLNEEIIISSIKSISELIEKSVKKSMSNFINSNNSPITGPFYNITSHGNRRLFYKIAKKKSDQQFIIEKNMLNKLTR